MRPFLVSASLVTAICTGVAVAQQPVAYVYVGQDAVQTPYSAIYAYAASSDGKLTEIKGSPFTQVTHTGIMLGDNGTHFVFVGQGPDNTGDNPLTYLYSYDVGSNGALGQQVSNIDTASYSGADCSAAQSIGPGADAAVLDHTGQFIYVPYCTGTIQTYKIAHSGDLSFQSAATYSNPDYFDGGAVKITGNDAYAYNQTFGTASNNEGAYELNLFAGEKDGSMEYRGDADVTGPSLPKNYYASFAGFPGNWYYPFDYAVAPLTNDPANHLAAMLTIEKFTPPDTTANQGCALASFTVGSHGQLTSTNTYDNMPHVCASAMLLSPSGKTLVVLPNSGTSLQFFHFNGSEPITKSAEVTAKSGSFSTMAWDGSNHLYALNGLSGKLHVYTVSSSKVVEAPGSPYNVPYCGYDSQAGEQGPNCPQNLVVRIVP
jgi:hypothetical protein